jgi:phosphoenolpyruvate synthase/pyruvate phosphate dikinase
MGLTVPHGFILPTSACDDFIENDCKDLSKFCRHAIDSGIRELEIKTGKLFGKEAKHYDPLIVAVRISAPVKMNG